MTELFDPLYKRTKKGGFVIWKVEGYTNPATNMYNVLITYGQVDGSSATTIKPFASPFSAVQSMKKIRDKKKAEGLYHTLKELNITKVALVYEYINRIGFNMKGTLLQALEDTLLALPKDDSIVKQKPLTIEPMLMIDPNLKITFHLPRV
jgi:hypothetical protein